MQEFKDKVAVVTGAASGIGFALAERFASEGMKVVLADIEEPALSNATQSLEQKGATVLACRVDVAKAEDIEGLAETAYSKFGAVHVVCNNAGVGGPGGFIWQQSLEGWQWVAGVNLFGVIHGIRSFVPRMLAGGEEGHIVNTSSVAGLASGPMIAPYYATKHGVVALSETLALELQIAKATQLGVSVLCPGFVKTRIIEMRNNPPLPQMAGGPDMGQIIRTMMEEKGIPPSSTAEDVLTAIRKNQFWILTHPEFDPMIRSRVDDMLERRNPVMRVS